MRLAQRTAERERLCAPCGVGAAVGERHLRFVPTPNGYYLDEQAGEPPAVGTLINGIDLPERLLVIKLGRSPLPHDQRVCAFPEREIPLAASPGRSPPRIN